MTFIPKLKVMALVLAAGLAGCQTTAPSRQPQPVDPVPPNVGIQTAPAPTQAQAAAPAAAQQQPQAATVITLHLAQQQQEPSLVAVDAGGDAPLYALPQPVLTQVDMGRISPVTAPDQSTFLLLEMNQNGIPKLRTITEQAQGHYLLLSVRGQLVSVAQIGEVITDGRLMVSTQNPQHTQAIIQMMQGG